jgi:hypothetical protein
MVSVRVLVLLVLMCTATVLQLVLALLVFVVVNVRFDVIFGVGVGSAVFFWRFLERIFKFSDVLCIDI